MSKIRFDPTDGENNPQAKVSEPEVRHIHRCAWNGVPLASLAALFGLKPSAVSMIKCGRTWAHLKLNK